MGSPEKRGSVNLTALGSAAVLAVYAAGYLRTKPIAQRYERSDSGRRPAPVAAPVRIDAERLVDTVRVDTLRPAASAPAATAPRKTKPVAAVEHTVRADTASVPKDTALSVPAVAATATDTAGTPADSAKAAADSVKVLKDGTYSGWGTSRHGDIQAAVEIQGGRIVKAYITQCLTRYSCSRIASIIPQVVDRQSAEVDYVSGATQSTDAFYYAIVEALSKAR
jgi:uncharacterized protein with FMN-binding domain